MMKTEKESQKKISKEEPKRAQGHDPTNTERQEKRKKRSTVRKIQNNFAKFVVYIFFTRPKLK